MNTPHNLLTSLGGAERDRTVGLLNAIQALSQLSYSPRNLQKQTEIKFNTDRERLSIQSESLRDSCHADEFVSRLQAY